MTKFIAIASGKGGAGKTTAAINIGCALSNFGKDVVVVDANLAAPHIAMSLGSMKLKRTLNDVLKGRRHITDAAYLHPSGLKIVPSDFSYEESMASLKAGSLGELQSKLTDLIGTSEIILLDSPAGISNEVSAIFKAADELILVVNPDMLSVSDALKTIRLAEENDCKVLGFILNKVSGDKSELDAGNVEFLLEKQMIGAIPEDMSVRKAFAINQPVVYSHPDAPAAVNFKKVAAKLMGQHYEETKKKRETSLWKYMMKQLGFMKEDA